MFPVIPSKKGLSEALRYLPWQLFKQIRLLFSSTCSMVQNTLFEASLSLYCTFTWSSSATRYLLKWLLSLTVALLKNSTVIGTFLKVERQMKDGTRKWKWIWLLFSKVEERFEKKKKFYLVVNSEISTRSLNWSPYICIHLIFFFFFFHFLFILVNQCEMRTKLQYFPLFPLSFSPNFLS